MPTCLFQTLPRFARVHGSTYFTALSLLCAHAALLPNGLSAQAAPAQPADAQSAAEAERLILQGVKLREQGQDNGALMLFERAYEVAPTPRALTQRALAEQALGAWVDAEQHLQQALAAKGDSWIEQHRATLQRSLVTIGAHLGSLQVNGGLPGSQLRVDGAVVGVLPLQAPLRVAVGESLLEVRLEGYYPVRRQIAVKAGALSTETVVLTPIPGQAAAEAAPEPASPSPAAPAQATATARLDEGGEGLPSWVFWTATGVTAALGGVTVWSGLNTKAQDDAYMDYVRMDAAIKGDGELGYERAHDAQTRTNILIGGTAVAAAATLVIGVFFTDWGGRDEAQPSAARVRVFGSADSYGLALDQRF